MNTLDLDKFNYEPLIDLKLSSNFYSVIIKKLILLEKNHKELNLDYIFLFGSCARGEAFYDSDVDMLLLTNSDNTLDILMEYHNIDVLEPISFPEVQIVVRNTLKFIDKNDDPTLFNKIVYDDLKLLRRYINEV